MNTIGVLGVQGAVEEHRQALIRVGVDDPPVIRSVEALKGVSGLIIPGGESTTIHKLLVRFGLAREIERRMKVGDLALLGTCAGLILLSHRLKDPGKRDPEPFGYLDVVVSRNAYGSQRDSHETPIVIDRRMVADWVGDGWSPDDVPETMDGVFIRAPLIKGVGEGATVFVRLDDRTPVGVVAGNVMGVSFHPELLEDPVIHRFFRARVERL